MRNYIIIFIFIVFSTTVVKAQQHTMYSQFFNNEIVYNPAVSGSKTYNPLVIQTRQQWLGFEDAPFTTTISYHELVNQNSALGAVFSFENTNPSLKSDLKLSYAFHVPLNSNRTFLSFGIAPSLLYYSLNFDLEDLPENQDPAFSASTFTSISYDLSSGVYLYNERLSLGFSCLNMLQSPFNAEVLSQSNQSVGKTSFGNNIQIMSFYSFASYNIDIINNDWSVEPILLLRDAIDQKQIIDFVTRVKYLNHNWMGCGYRSDGTLSFSFGFKSNRIHIGYAYDHQLTGEIMNYNYGTHEFVISFQLPAIQHNRHTNFWIF